MHGEYPIVLDPISQNDGTNIVCIASKTVYKGSTVSVNISSRTVCQQLQNMESCVALWLNVLCVAAVLVPVLYANVASEQIV